MARIIPADEMAEYEDNYLTALDEMREMMTHLDTLEESGIAQVACVLDDVNRLSLDLQGAARALSQARRTDAQARRHAAGL